MDEAAAAAVEAFWAAFRREHPGAPERPQEVFAFGDGPAMADELLALVLAGPKRATAGLLLEFEAESAPLPEPEGCSVVLDGAGRPRCVTRTTEVRIVPFREVDEAFARDEGEGERSLAWWREAHRAYFERACAKLGTTFREELPVVLERFDLA